jgi:hypothetical protein
MKTKLTLGHHGRPGALSAALLVAMGVGCGSSSEGASSAMDAGDGAAQGDGQSSSSGGSGSGSGGSSGSGSGGSSGGSSGSGSGGVSDSGTTGDGGTAGSPMAVNLGTAADFVILAKTGISTAPASTITGNLGLSPAAASYITGFSLIADATNVFSTSAQVTGKVYASTYAAPTPANLTTAIGDMQLAFTDAAGRAAGVTNLGAGNIGGKTLAPGVYKWGTGLLVPTDVTLSGSGTDVWIFEIAQDLTLSTGARIALTGGAVPANVFWQVSGATTLGTTAHIEGVVLCQTQIALKTGASINGRLLAQSAVTLEGNAVVAP